MQGLIPQGFSRFDIVEGHYLFCTLWHGGQWSDLYARLCRISRYFEPGPGWSESKILDRENEDHFMARFIYECLCEKHGFKPYDDND